MKRLAALLSLLALAAFAGAAGDADTVVTGDEMEIVDGGKVIVFSGSAKVVRGDSELTARKIVRDTGRGRVDASGDVRFRTRTPEGELVTGRSVEGSYFPEQERGELRGGRPEVTYHSAESTGPVHLQADLIRFDQKSGEMVATGAVEVVSSSATATSANARFLQGERKVVLTGGEEQPEVVYTGEDGKGRYRADRITVWVDSRKSTLEGRVRAVIDSARLKEIEEDR